MSEGRAAIGLKSQSNKDCKINPIRIEIEIQQRWESQSSKGERAFRSACQ